jgi:membrane protein DedA with SNARE-associated domain
MDDMLNNLSTYGYIVLFLYSLGGGFVALLGAGVLSFMGKMDISLSIAIAMTANFIGDSLMFYMSRYHKREMMEYFKQHRRKLAFSHSIEEKRVMDHRR